MTSAVLDDGGLPEQNTRENHLEENILKADKIRSFELVSHLAVLVVRTWENYQTMQSTCLAAKLARFKARDMRYSTEKTRENALWLRMVRQQIKYRAKVHQGVISRSKYYE